MESGASTPALTVRQSGVQPYSSGALGSAPPARALRTASTSPVVQENVRGLAPAEGAVRSNTARKRAETEGNAPRLSHFIFAISSLRAPTYPALQMAFSPS